MSAKDAQKRRSQELAARKRAKSKPGPRGPAVMTSETFHRMSAPIATSAAKKLGIPVEDVKKTMEVMAEEGCLGLDAQGELVPIKPALTHLLTSL